MRGAAELSDSFAIADILRRKVSSFIARGRICPTNKYYGSAGAASMEFV